MGIDIGGTKIAYGLFDEERRLLKKAKAPSDDRKAGEEFFEPVFDMIHDYQRRGILKSYSDANVVNVLFSPVKFMTMNRPAYDDMEAGLNELIAMMQDLLLY